LPSRSGSVSHPNCRLAKNPTPNETRPGAIKSSQLNLIFMATLNMEQTQPKSYQLRARPQSHPQGSSGVTPSVWHPAPMEPLGTKQKGGRLSQLRHAKHSFTISAPVVFDL